MQKYDIINNNVDVNGKLDVGAVPTASTISILGCVYVGAKLGSTGVLVYEKVNANDNFAPVTMAA